jgi:3-deoxy-D-arabino-heptulosonate 7-phosphate (DAHP) synthase
MPNYEPFKDFNAEYVNRIQRLKEKYNTKDQRLVIIKVYSKPVTYFCKIKGRVNDPAEATKLTEAEAIKIQKKILQKSEII